MSDERRTDTAAAIESPFRDVFSRAGASFVERDGRLVAELVEDFEKEYRASTETAVLIDRDHLGRIEVTGQDRELFLQNMLSQDVKTLEPGKGRRATFLTNKGKLVAEIHLFREDSRFLMETEASRLEPLATALSRYIISEDVPLKDLRESETSFSAEGPRAATVLGELAEQDPAELERLEPLSFHSVSVDGTPLRITAHRRELTPRFDVALARDRAAGILAQALEVGSRHGARLAGERVAETRRIEAGRPRFGVDVDESLLVLEAGLDDAISFDKGCYIGQEYVVRVSHRGHVNRKLSGLRIEGERVPPAGSAVTAGGERAGEVTSATFSPALGGIVALALLRRAYLEPGTELSATAETGAVAARVCSLPFSTEGG